MAPAAFAFHLRLQGQLVRDRRAERETRARLLREQAARERPENEARWLAVEKRHGAALPQPSPRIVLPSGPRRLVPLSRRRIERYRAHLEQTLAQALSADEGLLEKPHDPALDGPAAGDALRDRLCALCRGGCCTEGGETAYLQPATLRRWMASRPGLDAAGVVQAYLDRLAPRTERGSCINHGPSGCTLPREMRSQTCNRYLCDTLKGVREQQSSSAPPNAAVVVVRRLSNWKRQEPGRENGIVAVAVVTATVTLSARASATTRTGRAASRRRP